MSRHHQHHDPDVDRRVDWGGLLGGALGWLLAAALLAATVGVLLGGE